MYYPWLVEVVTKDQLLLEQGRTVSGKSRRHTRRQIVSYTPLFDASTYDRENPEIPFRLALGSSWNVVKARENSE